LRIEEDMNVPAPGDPLPRRRYALVGLSNRGVASFARPLLGTGAGPHDPSGDVGTDPARSATGPTGLGYGADADDYSGHAELVAVLDVDRERADAFVGTILPSGHPRVPVFVGDGTEAGDSAALRELIDRAQPDAVIVTSPDHTHVRYVLAALEAGVDVISEKPMVATAHDAQQVLDAQQRSAASVRVTHNLRFTSRHRRIKSLLDAGALGRLLHVSMDYHVDVRHGASYFLRWNRQRANSGGLSIHKSTHHLDLISWWLGSEPRTVYAVGGRDFYGATGAHRPPGAHTPQEIRDRDPYQRAQHGTGTFPDDADSIRRGLFDLPYAVQYPAGRDLTLYDTEIDVEDHLASLLTFSSGATAAYSVDFSSPWEGYRASIQGTEGTLEVFTGRTPDGEELPGSGTIVHRPLFAPAREVEIPRVQGGHDGADPMMRRDLFVGPSSESEELHLAATAREGALAVAAGEGIWRSIATGQVVDVPGLLV
jgi:predicted dehydrogenase